MKQIVRDGGTASSPETAQKESKSLLNAEILEKLGERAAGYDRESRFFFEDLDDLKALGYLTVSVPVELGGQGFTLPEVVREQARLAYRAPSTALALNMHLYWTGTAAYLWRKGDKSLEWILTETVAGKVFASGHGEPGNDLGLGYSSVRAEPLADGSYRFTGRKVFTSLSPVWDWLGLHARDDSDPAAPKIVHAFIRRQDPGHHTVETWDALGVRATRSDDTVLEGVITEAPYVSRILPLGPPVDPFIDGIFSSAILPIAAVYYGIAKRAFDLAVESAKSRTSTALDGKTYANHAYIQILVAQAAIELDSIWALLDRIAIEWADGVDHGSRWPAKLLAAKQHAVDGARRVVDHATHIAGASSLFRKNELERLYRDVRSGPFHPPNTDATHDVIGKTYLGLLEPAA
jgi:alkylation response protein AidB-like acyl-CoA dehydrogenase